MNSKLQRHFDKTESDRKSLMADLSQWPPEKLSFKKTSGQWSVNEIISHLITSERLTLLYLKKKSQGIATLKHSGIMQSLAVATLRIAQRLPYLKFNAPQAVVAATPAGKDIATLQKEWDRTRSGLREFCDSINEKDITKLMYKHPVIGRLDLKQCLETVDEHFQRHLKQINRHR